jgi:hypothetical protein
VTHRERKEGLLLKDILVRVIKELHLEISPKEKRVGREAVDGYGNKDRSG